MRTRTIAVVLGLALAATGCETTTEEANPAIDTTLALETAETVLMLASLGAEVGHVLDAPDFTFGACPVLDEDGDELVLDYGAGCAPGSATTGEDVSGVVSLVSPATNSIAYGVTEAFGFTDLPVAGEFTLATQRTGESVTVDLEIEGLTWTREGRDRSLSGLYTLVLEPEGTTVSLTSGLLVRGTTDEIVIEASDILIPDGGLGVCPRPSAGRIEMLTGGEEAVTTFSESTADDGKFGVLLDDDTEGQAVLDCENSAPADSE